MRHLPVVTTSEIQTFQRCQRLHSYKYLQGYRPVERAHALDFGSLVHSGLETWWKTAGNLFATGRALETTRGASALDGYDLIRADVMLSGYHMRWADEPITVLSVEQEFRVPIWLDGFVHELELAGKWDAVCEVDGRVFFPEHKTKSEKVDAAGYFTGLRGNVQVSNYLIAADALGHNPGGALYDVLVKPPEPKRATPPENRKYTKAGALYANQRAEDESPVEYRERLNGLISAAPDDYYQRAVVTRFEGELETARRDLWAAATGIQEARGRDYHPRTPDACRGFGRQCEFFEVCFGGASLDDASQFTKLENPHAELTLDTTTPAENPHAACSQ